MEFNFDLKDVVTREVLKIDNTMMPEGYENVDNSDYESLKRCLMVIIDEMGKASGVAQELMSPITSSEKLVKSDHVIYMMTEHNKPGHFSVVGILKMGWKKLYLYNKAGSRSEAMVYCLLDFYIHESKQRKGYGKRLIDYMLMDISLEARQLAIDKPTKKLLQFMWKHFQLSKLINQGNNFAIFEEFFIVDDDNKKNSSPQRRALAYQYQPKFGRHGAHKHHDTMGEIVQGEGDAAFVKFKYNPDTEFVDNQFKEVNPHPENKGAFEDDKDGKSVKRDIKNHHESLW